MSLQFRDIILRLPGFLIAISFHEYAHARMALHLGDDTALRSGRLTLEPWAHIDPVGAMMLILFGFGWALPVPINPYRFKDPKKDSAKVALAGPLVNFVLAIFFEVLAIILFAFLPATGGALNYLPIVFTSAALVNAGLGVFNLIPLPPLDGSRILEVFLPNSFYEIWGQIQRYGFLILSGLLITGVLPKLMGGPMSFIMSVGQKLGFFIVRLFVVR